MKGKRKIEKGTPRRKRRQLFDAAYDLYSNTQRYLYRRYFQQRIDQGLEDGA